ncbi:MAG: hypothetical protein Q8R47_03665 [Nanoarchaeota archaeon]|nr:hypothetical protein [Nanoarchaeota archaeon]
MTSYKAYYEILNSRNNSYEEHHMYLGAHSHSDAETRVRDFIKSLYHYEPRIIAIYTTEEENEARWLEFHLQRARTKEPITSKTPSPITKNF